MYGHGLMTCNELTWAQGYTGRTAARQLGKPAQAEGDRDDEQPEPRAGGGKYEGECVMAKLSGR
eukprot:873781-Rhodomonas_salina.1